MLTATRSTLPITATRAVMLSLGFLAVISLAGCGDDVVASPTPSASPTSTSPSLTTPSPTAKTPEQLAQAAVEQYLAISEKAQKSGKLADLDPLTKVATGDAFFNMRKTVQTYSQNDIRLEGTIGHALAPAAMPNDKKATVTDCQDLTKSKVVKQDTGQVIKTTDPNGKEVSPRYKVEYTVTVLKSSWRVESVNHRWDQTC